MSADREPYYEGEGCYEWETEQLAERARWRNRIQGRLLQLELLRAREEEQDRLATKEELYAVADELNRRFP